MSQREIAMLSPSELQSLSPRERAALVRPEGSFGATPRAPHIRAKAISVLPAPTREERRQRAPAK